MKYLNMCILSDFCLPAATVDFLRVPSVKRCPLLVDPLITCSVLIRDKFSEKNTQFECFFLVEKDVLMLFITCFLV